MKSLRSRLLALHLLETVLPSAEQLENKKHLSQVEYERNIFLQILGLLL